MLTVKDWGRKRTVSLLLFQSHWYCCLAVFWLLPPLWLSSVVYLFPPLIKLTVTLYFFKLFLKRQPFVFIEQYYILYFLFYIFCCYFLVVFAAIVFLISLVTVFSSFLYPDYCCLHLTDSFIFWNEYLHLFFLVDSIFYLYEVALCIAFNALHLEFHFVCY